jgi:hypothetical protein
MARNLIGRGGDETQRVIKLCRYKRVTYPHRSKKQRENIFCRRRFVHFNPHNLNLKILSIPSFNKYSICFGEMQGDL